MKAWVSSCDDECVTESTVYQSFRSHPMNGIPIVLANSFDTGCQVHAIVLQLLGATLDDVRRLRSGGKFNDKMVLAVAIQMVGNFYPENWMLLLIFTLQLDRYRDIHARGIIHNGIKPANICLPPPGSVHELSTLHVIDFGLSLTLDTSSQDLLPSACRADTVGNRSFLSIYGHHGISMFLTFIISSIYPNSLFSLIPFSSITA